MTMTVLKMLRIQDVMQRNEREVQGEYIYIYIHLVSIYPTNLNHWVAVSNNTLY